MREGVQSEELLDDGRMVYSLVVEPRPNQNTDQRAAKVLLEYLGQRAVTGPLNEFARSCHADNQHWWHDPKTGEKLVRNKGEMICLMHSELSEAMEGERKNLMDDHLPHRKSVEVELADLLIRVFDYAGAYGLDLDGAVAEKREYNAHRADHKPENRLKEGGKQW